MYDSRQCFNIKQKNIELKALQNWEKFMICVDVKKQCKFEICEKVQQPKIFRIESMIVMFYKGINTIMKFPSWILHFINFP